MKKALLLLLLLSFPVLGFKARRELYCATFLGAAGGGDIVSGACGSYESAPLWGGQYGMGAQSNGGNGGPHLAELYWSCPFSTFAMSYTADGVTEVQVYRYAEPGSDPEVLFWTHESENGSGVEWFHSPTLAYCYHEHN